MRYQDTIGTMLMSWRQQLNREAGKLNLTCRRCGREIRRGFYCAGCAADLEAYTKAVWATPNVPFAEIANASKVHRQIEANARAPRSSLQARFRRACFQYHCGSKWGRYTQLRVDVVKELWSRHSLERIARHSAAIEAILDAVEADVLAGLGR